MARQRFIWPSLWDDQEFGVLKSDEQVLFIGLFSLADDDGRLHGDADFLRARVFTYAGHTAKRVAQIRDRLVAKMRNVQLYSVDGCEYIALMKWSEYQKPKYRKPSKLPPPPTQDSGNVGGTLGERSAIGLGLDCDRVGLGWASTDHDAIAAKTTALNDLLDALGVKDRRLREEAHANPERAIPCALVAREQAQKNPAGYFRRLMEAQELPHSAIHNGRLSDQETIEKMIENGVIRDYIDLDAELRAFNLSATAVDHLRAMLSATNGDGGAARP